MAKVSLLCVFILSILMVTGSVQAQDTALSVNAVVWSPTEEHIAVVLNDRTNGSSLIRLYNTATLELIQTLENTTGIITTFNWSPDGQQIVIHDTDGSVYIRNPFDGEVVTSFLGPGPESPAPSMIGSTWSFDGTFLANGYAFGVGVDIRNGDTGEWLSFANPETFPLLGQALDFAWSDHDNKIALTDFSNTVTIFDTQSDTVVNQQTLDLSYILAWQGDYFYALKKDNLSDFLYACTFQVWDSETGERISDFTVGLSDSIWRWSVSGNGQWFVITRPGNILQLWDAFSGNVVQSQQFSPGSRMALSPTSDRIAVAKSNGDLTIAELPLTGEHLPPTPSDKLLFFQLDMPPDSLLRLAKVSEAPIDVEVDTIGYYGLPAAGLAYNNQPPYFNLSPKEARFIYAKEDTTAGYAIFENSINHGGELDPIVTEGWNLYPAYSPAEFGDDAQIAFWHSDDETDFVLSILDTNRELIQTISLPNPVYLDQPAWFPDRQTRRIAFSMWTEAGDYDIYAIDLDDSSIETLMAHPANDHSPRWSPDGKALVFVSDRNETDGIFRLDLATGEVRFLAEGEAPAWSPDGAKIAFTQDKAIYVMDADGENVRLFIDAAVFPRWTH